MPGQRKRKRKRQRERSARTHRSAQQLPPGSWQVVFATQDYEEWREYLRTNRAAYRDIDPARLRMDTLCGRLVVPTTYRLCLYVPAVAGE